MTVLDIGAALDFLRRFAPEASWALSASNKDQKFFATKTFSPGKERALTQWVEAQQGCRRNIYFLGNPTIRDMDKKSERENIKAVCWLHIDIDPRAGENLVEEQAIALGKLTSNLPEGVPPPTVIIFSGGGHQAFWKLAEPIQINGDLELAEDAALYNVKLEIAFGADNCHNIDRIMRLPGTINYPDGPKAKKGRVPALANLVEFNDLSYPVSAFTKADAAGAAAPTEETAGATISDLDDLDFYRVPDGTKRMIKLGHDPERPKKEGQDKSRNPWLLEVVCTLRRCGVPDTQILGIIMDPRWKISESVLEKGSGALKYAQKQIQAARDRVTTGEEWLGKLNKNHAVLLQDGGKCRVLSYEKSELVDGRLIPIFQTFSDIRNRYLNQDVIIGLGKGGIPKAKKVGSWWLEHPARREYTALRFAPDKPREFDGYLNLWQGFAIDPAPGDWSLFKANMLRLVGGNESYLDYTIKWHAWAFQNPATQADVSITYRGKRGVGKGIHGRGMVRIFGQHGLQIYTPAHLVGQFNSHMRDLVLLFADEAYTGADKKAESVIKTIHTEPTIIVEAKGVDLRRVPNRLHIINASNEKWVVPAGIDERRFAIFDVADEIPDRGYFDRLIAEIDNGGLGAMLHELLALDLEGWHPRLDVPQTKVLAEQKAYGDDHATQWIFGILDSGIIKSRKPSNKFAPPRTYLAGPLLDLMRKQIPALAFMGDPTLTQILKDWGWKSWKSGNNRGWAAPSLLAMRARFEAEVRPVSWDDDLVDFDEYVEDHNVDR